MNPSRWISSDSPRHHGVFYAKDTELQASSDRSNLETLARVRRSLTDNPERLDSRRDLHLAKYGFGWDMTRPHPFAQRLATLEREAEARGIRLVFMLPPLLTPDGVRFAFPAYLRLGDGAIDLSDPRRLPELYDADNVFDLEHVNSGGAVLLSEHLGNALRADDGGPLAMDVSVMIFGATRGTGLEAAGSLVAKGLTVTAAVRDSSDTSALEALGVNPVIVDVFDSGDVATALRESGCTAIVLSLSGKRGETHRADREGVKAIVDAAGCVRSPAYRHGYSDRLR